MISANELRIGNWIDAPLYRERVIDILCDGVNTKSAEGLPYDEINPIPLTPEILEKCGFDKYSSYCFENGVCKWEYDWDEINGSNFVELKYLHQLQNLYFALTGEELQINLGGENILETKCGRYSCEG